MHQLVLREQLVPSTDLSDYWEEAIVYIQYRPNAMSPSQLPKLAKKWTWCPT